MKQNFSSVLGLMVLPILVGLSASCGSDGDSSNSDGGSSAAGNAANAGATSRAGASSHAGATGNVGLYDGPTVGTAQPFAALAYSAISAANVSPVTGKLGVSAGAMSTITGFDADGDEKYGTDSLAPDSQRTILAQQDVTALVGDIDPRACDADFTDVVGGLTGDVTDEILRQCGLRIQRDGQHLDAVPGAGRELAQQDTVGSELNARADLQFMRRDQQEFELGMKQRFAADDLQKLRTHDTADCDQILAESHRIGQPLLENRREGAAVITTQIAMIGDVIFEGPGLDPAIYYRIIHYPLSILRIWSTPLTRAAR